MRDEWTKGVSGGKLVRFTYADLPDGAAFLTAQIANHDVVYSVIVEKTEQPFSRLGVERHFEYEFRPISD